MKGVVDGVPWYAMELLRGKTLRTPRSIDYYDGSARTIPAGQAIAHSAGHTRFRRRRPSRNRVQRRDRCDRGWQTDSGTLRPIRRAFEPVPKVPLERTLTLVHRLCSPLAFLHGEGLVHRDLKPDNVLVRPNGSPVLVDFGVTTQFTGEQSREALEVGGEMVGTVSYMAPEQILGDFVDARADLYALGCILYELLTGRPPFVGADRIEVGRAHLHSRATAAVRTDGWPALSGG
jgi:serine/threonine protein kinase